MREALTLSIEGMHCGACVRRVTAALEGVKGVELGTVAVGSAKMAFDSDRVDPQEIVAAIDRIGFSAHVGRE